MAEFAHFCANSAIATFALVAKLCEFHICNIFAPGKFGANSIFHSRSDVGNSANATITNVHSTSTSSDSSVQISNDAGRWKSLSESERDSVTLTGPQPLPKSLPKNSKGRSFLMSIFLRKMPKGETVARDWLVWSETAQSLFCFCSCLFATKFPSSAQSEFSHPQLGCNDKWQKLYEKTEAHAKNVARISNYLKWRDLISSLDISKGIDSFQQRQFGKKEGDMEGNFKKSS